MSKPLLYPRFNSPEFIALEKEWYEKLEKSGFQDQESNNYPDRPLKRWTGISSIYVDQFQPAGKNLISSFPESIYREEESFQNHPGFEELCRDLCQHGNRRISPKKIKRIWTGYCDGKTLREMEETLLVSDTTIYRIIRTITDWMRFMQNADEEIVPEESLEIILRKYDPDLDKPMIFSTWRNAVWFGEKRDDRFAAEFYSWATRVIRSILNRPDADIRIACAKNDPTHIVGYAILTGDHLQFVYVKVDYRRRRIARLLTQGFKTVTPAATRVGKAIIQKLKLTERDSHEI